MYNRILFMSNSLFKRFKKDEEEPIVEEKPPVWEDRIFWVEMLEKIAYPVLNNLSRDSLKRNMDYESHSPQGQNFVYLEAFSRVFNGIAPWLELGVDDSQEGQLRKKYTKLTIKSIKNAVNPHSNDYIFSVDPKQSLVEVALFAQGLLRAKNNIWLNLSMDVQARITRILKKTRVIAPYENHWLLFTAIIEATLLEFTGECDMQRLSYGVMKFRDEFYLGDAVYSDGEDYDVGYCNSLFIHPMLNDILKVMRKYNLQDGEFLDVQYMRSSRLSSQLERMISPEGTYPVLGKSLSYRSGIFHLLSQAALLKILPNNIDPAQVRGALTQVLRKHFEGDQNFNENGWLKIGINGSQADISEKEVNTGSLYFCCAVFLPLGLGFNDPFWDNPYSEWSSLKAWNGNELPKDQSIDF